MKELAIGEEIRIRCVEGRKCDRCCFYDDELCNEFMCGDRSRADHEDVHFELVDDVPEIHFGNILPTDEEICTYSSMYFTGSAVHYVREGMRIMKKMIEEKLNKIE